MRYLVVSDIHSNAPALEAVLQAAPDHDAIVCLGDIVGYGPDPNLCTARVRELGMTSLAGNHDLGAIGRADLRLFNRDARQALLWTQERLSKVNETFLRDLSAKTWLTDGVLLAHGSGRDPVWEYLVDTASAQQMFLGYDFDLALVGHSHLPLVLEWREADERVHALRSEEGVPLHLGGRRLILNPGSVGQPRDGNPKASYALMDTDAMTWVFQRRAYPVEITQERMRAQGLPWRLIDRLEYGR